MPRIRARERLEFCLDVMAALPSEGRGVSPLLAALVVEAYPEDETTRATLLEALTRS
jgi:hypothetical protein